MASRNVNMGIIRMEMISKRPQRKIERKKIAQEMK
jgi:hypothetical protein